MNSIKNNLNAFYIRYAQQTGLTVAQVEQRVSQWDIQQFKQAVDVVNQEINAHDTDRDIKVEAKKRVKKATITATISRKELMLSIASLAIVLATLKAHKHAKVRIKLDIKDEIAMREASQAISRHLPEFATNLSSSLWNTCDGLNNMIDYLVNKNLSGDGLTQLDIQKLFPYINQAKLPVNSISNYVERANNIAIRVIRTESARMNYEVTMADFRRRKVKMANWVTEPGACETCEGIADDGPYRLAEVPDIPVHPNCRCTLEEYTGES